MCVIHAVSVCLTSHLAMSALLLLITSKDTPPQLLTQASEECAKAWLESHHQIEVIPSSNIDYIVAELPRAVAVLDATYSAMQTEVLAGVCAEFEVPQIVLGYVCSPRTHRWSFYVNGRQMEVTKGLQAVAEKFQWNSLNVASDGNPQMIDVDRGLSTAINREYRSIKFARDDEASIGTTVGRIMRMSGNRVTVFLTLPGMTLKIAAEQMRKYIGGTGFGNLMPLLSSLYESPENGLDTGNLILAEEELAEATTQEDYYRLIVSQVSEMCGNLNDPFTCLAALNAKYPSHYRESSFVLLNTQRGQRIAVGRVTLTGEVAISGLIYFLGNSSVVPTNAQISMQISANFGSGNVDSVMTTPIADYSGAVFAINEVNKRTDILENFRIDLFNFTAGVTQWSYEYAYSNIYPYRDRLGLVVLSGYSSTVTMRLIGLLGDIGYHGPVLASSNTVNQLSSRSNYPSFIRTVLPDSYINRVYMQMFKRFGWTQCGLFVSNETWGLGFQRDFVKYAKDSNVTIVNAAEFQVLPTPIPSIETLYPYRQSLTNFTNTKVRVLILVVNSNAVLVVDYLYELGLRAGDVQIVASGWISYTSIHTNDTVLFHRRSELLRGAIQFSPVTFVGKLGVKVYNDFKKAYGLTSSSISCFYYDSALAVAYTLDFLAHSGQDYMNPAIVLKYLRDSRFVGCSGVVTFDPDTNDRSPMPYDILNAQFSHSDSVIDNITTVGRYDPTSTVLFKFYSNIVWCDGTGTVPKDVRESSVGCPFEDKFDQDFAHGRYVLYAVIGAISAETFMCAVVMWRLFWRRRPVQQLMEKKEIQVSDVIASLQIAVETIQYLSIGPRFEFLVDPAVRLVYVSLFDFSDIITYKNGVFEKVWLEVFAASGLWVLLFIVALFSLDERLKRVPGCLTLGSIADIFVPIIASYLFVPIVSVLLDVFVCTEGLGLVAEEISFRDSYLHKDCYMRCWEGTHMLLVAGSSIALLVFIPLSTFAKPLFQELRAELHIKASPLFLFVKTVCQVVLISLCKAVTNTVAHCSAYLCVFVCLLLFSLKHSCFSYVRTNLWYLLSLISVLWFASLVLAERISGLHTATCPFCIATVSGWCGIVLFGVLYQKLRLPNLLYRKPGVNTIVLFRFAFSRTTPYILSEINNDFKKVGNRSIVSGAAPIERFRQEAAIHSDQVMLEMHSMGAQISELR